MILMPEPDQEVLARRASIVAALRQIAAVIALCRGIMLRRRVAPHRVLGHSDVAPGRKKDPGEKFPWKRLAQSGFARNVRFIEESCPAV